MPSSLTLNSLPPLSLYIHIPWCVRKCPYCDFNSHQANGELPIQRYIDALEQDLKTDAFLAQGRKLESIFFGGGTPSLLPAKAVGRILDAAATTIGLSPTCEITLEANPGTAEYDSFNGYRSAGVNRLSMGVQSFDAQQLKTLGRIHSPNDVIHAFELARKAGFDNMNLDLMFALPQQTRQGAAQDLKKAIALAPEHLSWYQLTIEPNTEFYSRPPQQPEDDTVWDIQQHGQQQLAEAGYHQYEISAYAQPHLRAAHNMNYWQFGDYLAIGAGAHGKITQLDTQHIMRFRKTRMPEHYLGAMQKQVLQGNPFNADSHHVDTTALPFEFMMNALRLVHGVPTRLYSERTGLSIDNIQNLLQQQQNKALLAPWQSHLQATPLGHQYLNNLLEAFLAET